MKSAEEAGLRALKIGTKRNIAISVDPEKAASALELSKDRRIEDLERQVRFLETRLMYLKKLKALAHPRKESESTQRAKAVLSLLMSFSGLRRYRAVHLLSRLSASLTSMRTLKAYW